MHRTLNVSPTVLLMVRQRVVPGNEAEYSRLEVGIKSDFDRLGCPNPYVALESMSGPKEVWFVNAASSLAEKQRIEHAYAQNRELMAALTVLTERKKPLVSETTTLLVEYDPAASGSNVWTMVGTRYVAMGFDAPATTGAAVYVTQDGRRVSLRRARSR